MNAGFGLSSYAEPATEIGTNSASTIRDLKRRGFALGRTKTPSGQWAASLTKGDGSYRYVAQREIERLLGAAAGREAIL